MTKEERLAANKQGFEGDTFIPERIKELIAKHGIKYIIETGTYHGFTTRRFAEMVDHVTTVESNRSFYEIARETLKDCTNVNMVKGNSGNCLTLYTNDQPTLFYLDAHWYKECPLLDELTLIAIAKIRPVICIHDWKVPARDFGYDKFPDGTPFSLPAIRKHLDKIYGEHGYFVSYNKKANGCYRGVIYIEPKS